MTIIFAGLVTGSVALAAIVVYVLIRIIPTGIYPITDVIPETIESPLPESADPNAPLVTAPAPFDANSTVVLNFTDILWVLLIVLLLTSIVMAAGAAGVGWIVAGRVLRPLQSIDEVARRVAKGDLSRRVEVSEASNEIDNLGVTLNRMLDALQRSVDAHSRFAANVSHELRTPISIAQTMIDVTLSDDSADTSELRQLALDLRGLNTRSLRTVDALLDLADAENSSPPATRVDLTALTATVVGAAEPTAHSADITIHRSGESEAYADVPEALIQQAVDNIVRNAVRHNHPGGEVWVNVTDGGSRVHVSVANTGPVLDPEKIPTLTEPFVRGTERVQGPDAGRGLGLAIVHAIAQQAKADLTIKARPEGGLTVTLTLNSADRQRAGDPS
ncbi:sensor histidine kinase [Microbacterium sp. NPDC087589]|uniref:sensor histidine kinase n=1 Tax=Microbacterium sp. NPDC087589 TaxID=3364191 RepID=UPI0038026545